MSDKSFIRYISVKGHTAARNGLGSSVSMHHEQTPAFRIPVMVYPDVDVEMVCVRRDSFDGFDSPEHAAQVAEEMGNQLNAMESGLRALATVMGMDPEAPLALLPQHAAHVYATAQAKPEETVAQMYAERLFESQATNYIESSFTCSSDEKPYLGTVIVTIRREDGKTPHMLREEAELKLKTMIADRDAEMRMKAEARNQRDTMTSRATHLGSMLRKVRDQFVHEDTLLYESITQLLKRTDG